jgi:plastocyanin
MTGAIKVKPTPTTPTSKPVQTIEVGREGNTFTYIPAGPSAEGVQVRLGDVVRFVFPQVKHDVVRSDLLNGCSPSADPAAFLFKPFNTSSPLIYDYTITAPADGSNQIYFYCTPHCTVG